jgi:hypothetical protein
LFFQRFHIAALKYCQQVLGLQNRNPLSVVLLPDYTGYLVGASPSDWASQSLSNAFSVFLTSQWTGKSWQVTSGASCPCWLWWNPVRFASKPKNFNTETHMRSPRLPLSLLFIDIVYLLLNVLGDQIFYVLERCQLTVSQMMQGQNKVLWIPRRIQYSVVVIDNRYLAFDVVKILMHIIDLSGNTHCP